MWRRPVRACRVAVHSPAWPLSRVRSWRLSRHFSARSFTDAYFKGYGVLRTCLLASALGEAMMQSDTSSAQAAIAAAYVAGVGATAQYFPSGQVSVCTAQWPGFVMPGDYAASLNASYLKDERLVGGMNLSTSQLAGFDVEMVDLVLGMMLGLNITWRLFDTFAGLRLGLRVGACDVGIGALDMYPQESNCFSCPAAENYTQLGVSSSDYATGAAAGWRSAGCCLDFSVPYLFSGFSLFSLSQPSTSFREQFIGSMLSPATIYVFLVLILTTLCAGYGVYAIELFTHHHSQFRDLLTSIYWSAATLSTAGYGDLSPTSNFARLYTTLYLLVIVILLAFLAGQVASAMTTLSLTAAKPVTSLSGITGTLCVEAPYFSLADWLSTVPTGTKPPPSRTVFAPPSACVAGVLNGSFQASITERVENLFYGRSYGGPAAFVSNIISDGIGYVWMLPSNSPHRSFLNTAILEARFGSRWGPSRAAILQRYESPLAPPPSAQLDHNTPVELLIPIVVLFSVAILQHAHVHDHFPRLSAALRLMFGDLRAKECVPVTETPMDVLQAHLAAIETSVKMVKHEVLIIQQATRHRVPEQQVDSEDVRVAKGDASPRIPPTAVLGHVELQV